MAKGQHLHGVGAGAGLALQRCRNCGLAKRLAPRGRGTGFRSDLVHTDNVGATTASNALYDIRSLVEERSFLTVRSHG